VSCWKEQPKIVDDQPVSRTRETNILLMLRALANTIRISPDGSVYGAGVWNQKLFAELSQGAYEHLNKNQRVAYATLLFNFSCIELVKTLSPDVQSAHLALVLKALTTEKTDSETAYRALAALGNSVYGRKLKDSSIVPIIDALPNIFKEDRVLAIVAEIKALLAA